MDELDKFFSIAVSAEIKINPYTISVHMLSGIVTARNHDEATGKALQYCKKIFPIHDGYYAHSVSVSGQHEWILKKLEE